MTDAAATFAELYPFASHYLDLDGQRYHYLDEGDGPPLLLLHGNPSWSFYYRNLVLGLRDRYRVIVPDHIGCGLSDKPADYPYSLATHVANLRRLIAHLGLERFSMGVHDWGGPIGLGVTVEQPELLERLIVFNSTVEVTRRYPWRILVCTWPVLGPVAIRGLNLFAIGAAHLGVGQALAPAVRAGLLKPYDSYAHRVAILRFVQDIPLSPAHPSWTTANDIADKVPRLAQVPTMICWGMRDFCFTPPFLDHWRAMFPQAAVHEFAAAGHYVVEDEHAAIVPLMRDFLAREDHA